MEVESLHNALLDARGIPPTRPCWLLFFLFFFDDAGELTGYQKTRRCIYGDLRVFRCRRVGCEVSETVPDLVESGHGPKNLPFEKMFAHVLCSGLHSIPAVPYSKE